MTHLVCCYFSSECGTWRTKAKRPTPSPTPPTCTRPHSTPPPSTSLWPVRHYLRDAPVFHLKSIAANLQELVSVATLLRRSAPREKTERKFHCCVAHVLANSETPRRSKRWKTPGAFALLVSAQAFNIDVNGILCWTFCSNNVCPFELLGPVVLNLFYISYPFIRQDYQIYPQYTQWSSFIENTKLTRSYSLEWFIKIYIGCNLWFCKFTPLENEIYLRLRANALDQCERVTCLLIGQRQEILGAPLARYCADRLPCAFSRGIRLRGACLERVHLHSADAAGAGRTQGLRELAGFRPIRRVARGLSCFIIRYSDARRHFCLRSKGQPPTWPKVTFAWGQKVSRPIDPK